MKTDVSTVPGWGPGPRTGLMIMKDGTACYVATPFGAVGVATGFCIATGFGNGNISASAGAIWISSPERHRELPANKCRTEKYRNSTFQTVTPRSGAPSVAKLPRERPWHPTAVSA